MAAAIDNTQRFSDRVKTYVAHRPSYPTAAVSLLVDHFKLAGKQSTIVDLGSGTGILSRLLLDNPNIASVIGVEPNGPMRQAGEEYLAPFISNGRFRSVGGTAEETGLEDDLADLIVAGQAFHWFDVERTRLECQRLLAKRSNAGVALIWNDRRGGDGRTETTPFLQAYEKLLQTHSKTYSKINHHTTVTAEVLQRFFGPGGYEMKQFTNPYQLDYEQLSGRMLSSSYTPQIGEEGHDAMMAGLRRIFDEHQTDGRVNFLYDTKIMYGSFSE